MHANYAFRTRRMPHAWHHHRHQQQHQQVFIYNALHWLHCISLQWIALLHCVALHCIALIALHCIRTCLESFVGYAEISQWPLDVITRLHAHVLMNAFTFAFADDMFGICCEICRISQWPLDCTTRIHVHVRDRKTHRTDIKTQRETTRTTDRQTRALVYVSAVLALSVSC